MIQLKRAYDEPSAADGQRFLVDRLWPRGKKRDALKLEGWIKEAAPSGDLCQWFGHDPDRWDEFRRRYAAELDAHPAAWAPLLDAARRGTVTLVYAARDTEHNNALVLKRILDEQLGGP